MQSIRKNHPLTGEPLYAVGFRKPRASRGEVGLQPIWPIMGGDPTNDGGDGGDGDGGDQGGDGGDGGDGGTNNDPTKGEDGKTDEERGYPLKTPEADMTIEQKLAYRTAQMRKHQSALEKATAAGMTPEKFAQLVKAEEERVEAAKTETQRAVDAARNEGRESALAEAASGTVSTLIAAHAVAAKLDKTKDAEVFETLEALNVQTFIGEDHTVDADKLTKVLNRIVPLGGGSTGTATWPATGQGRQNTGTGSAKDAGHAEAVRRGYRKPDQ